MDVILDPRARVERPAPPPAPRPDPERLRRRPVLLHDNGKLAEGAYPEVFPRLRERLAECGVARVIERREPIRGASAAALRERARALAASGAVAAVVALADVGVSPATALLAIALEAEGVPTVCLTADPGDALARAVASHQVLALGLVRLDLTSDADVPAVRAAVDRAWPEILDALTRSDAGRATAAGRDSRTVQAPPGRDEHAIRPVSPSPVRADGLLDVTPWLEGDDDAAWLDAVLASFRALGIGDGLPVVPPTPPRYAAMLAFSPWDPATPLVGDLAPSGATLTVRELAIAAVMAGCRPEHFPIVVTAVRAMARPEFNLLQGLITSHNSGHLLIVSGPIAAEAGLHGGAGCLGPGFPGNAAVGRAVNLALVNVSRAVPGVADLGCLGSPAEWTYCFAEAAGPWPPINAERFDDETTTVLALKAEPPHGVTDFRSRTADDLLGTLLDCCTSLGSNNAYMPGSLVLVLAPDHARRLAAGGWDKAALRERIHAAAGHDLAVVAPRGIAAITPEAGADGRVRVTRSPRDVEIVVAGGHGGHPAVIRPWALASEAVVEPVRRADGALARRIAEFRAIR
jgi:hypothetical protein